MDRIIQEKISADHLLYVSLKYTKTGDVILNLIARWRSLIGQGMDRILEKAKKKRLVSRIPIAPKQRLDNVRKVFKNERDVIDALELYEFFKVIDKLEKLKENEFRKNVVLRVLYKGEWLDIDMDKLKEYSEVVDRFINYLKHFLS